MKIKTIKNSLKITFLFLLMTIGVQNVHATTPGVWSEWFTIEELGFDLWGTNGVASGYSMMSVVPDTPPENFSNPSTCANTDRYDLTGIHIGDWNDNSGHGPMRLEVNKLVTLAFTAGYEIRFFIHSGGCSVRQRPEALSLEIKK